MPRATPLTTPPAGSPPAAPSAPPAPPEPSTQVADAWLDYTSHDGGYQVRLPGSVVLGQREESMFGLRFKTTLAAVRLLDQQRCLVLSWQAIGREDLDLRQIMEAMMIQVTSGFGGQVVDAKPVIHDGLSGKDAGVTAVDGGQQLSGRMRALYAADRMYLLVWLGPPESYRRDQTSQLFDSFRVIHLPSPPVGVAENNPATPAPVALGRDDTSPLAAATAFAKLTETQRQAVYRSLRLNEEIFQKLSESADRIERDGNPSMAASFRKSAEDSRRKALDKLRARHGINEDQLEDIRREGKKRSW